MTPDYALPPVTMLTAPSTYRAAEVQYNWLAVGAGFAVSVLAGRLATGQGERVLVVDRRPFVAGSAFDHLNAAGLPEDRYEPHIFVPTRAACSINCPALPIGDSTGIGC